MDLGLEGWRSLVGARRSGRRRQHPGELHRARARPQLPARRSPSGALLQATSGIYRYAEQRLGQPLLHVPASARDVRGALEAGVAVVRVRRAGHAVDPARPAPDHELDDLRPLVELLAATLMEEA